MTKFLSKDTWELWIVKVNHFFSRPIGLLIAISLMFLIMAVFFAIRVDQAQKHNQDILRDTQQLAADNKTLTEQLKAVNEAQSQSVEALKADNAQQTVILCTLILSQDVNLNDERADEVEAICQERIRRNNEGSAQPNSVSQNPPDNQNTNGQSTPQADEPQQPEKPPDSPPTNGDDPADPGVIETLQSVLQRFLIMVLGAIGL